MTNLEKEKQEAIAAGENALVILKNVRSDLKGAETWGWIDIFGGGMISSLIKHGDINHAKQEMEEAGNAIREFSNELKDLDINWGNLEFGNLISLIDVFCDNWIVDIVVQEKIIAARKQVDEAIEKVNIILDDLKGLTEAFETSIRP